MTRFLTIRQFMERYQVSRSTVYRLIGSDAIQPVKIGRAVRIPAESATAWELGLAPPANDNG
jgi:excisionase family DNA binding protein